MAFPKFLVVPIGAKAGFAMQAADAQPSSPKPVAGPPPPKHGYGNGPAHEAEKEDEVIMVAPPKPLGVKMPPPPLFFPPPVKGKEGAKAVAKPPPAMSKNQQ